MMVAQTSFEVSDSVYIRAGDLTVSGNNIWRLFKQCFEVMQIKITN